MTAGPYNEEVKAERTFWLRYVHTPHPLTSWHGPGEPFTATVVRCILLVGRRIDWGCGKASWYSISGETQ